MKKKLFIAATRQNDGKTTVSLGLFRALLDHEKSLAYMKPVGQQYRVINGNKIDKDAVLFQKTFNLDENDLPLMSPIASPRGFTENYIDAPRQKELSQKILQSNNTLLNSSEAILYEGTGHAAVGSVFDLSNGAVAKLLNTPVIIVCVGGIGRSIDEIMLNVSTFRELGVNILGVIINKVLPEKYEKINTYVKRGLSRLGIDVLGVIPLNERLTFPTIRSIIDELDPITLSLDKDGEQNIIKKFIIGDMMPHDALNSLSNNTLMIIPGNREGVVLTALCENLLTNESHYVSGIIFTNGIKPHEKILDLLKTSKIPLFMVNDDAFSIATKINHMIVKIRYADKKKISIAGSIIEKHVDIDRIYSAM